jgi:hypothetical protein
VTCKGKATPSGLTYEQQRASVRRTPGPASTGRASFLLGWPTPDAANRNLADCTWEARRAESKDRWENGNGFGLNLGQAVQLSIWPTPNASLHNYFEDPDGWKARQDRRKADGSGAFAINLGIAARLTTWGWATPNTGDAHPLSLKTHKIPEVGQVHNQQLAAWATPITTDAYFYRVTENSAGEGTRMDSLARQAFGILSPGSTAATERPGLLNPEHSRWLMGFPRSWTSCVPTATPSSPKSRRRS